MSMHGRTIPGQSPNASLLVCCAHRWEADPFLAACQAKVVEERGGLPFPLWRATPAEGSESPLVEVLLTGSGLTRATAACSGRLALLLNHRRLEAKSTTDRPPLLVANFGTAGAYRGQWSPGQSLLANRILGPGSGSVHYPERLVKTSFEETECRTVLTPQSQIDEVDAGGPRQPIFDMEAWGIAEVVSWYLSWSHLVVGKFVLDQIPHPTEEPLDWRSLVEPHQQAYKEAAEAFLGQALDHLQALISCPRHQAAGKLHQWSEETLVFVASRIHLSVTQKRELLNILFAWASGVQGEEAWREKTQEIEAHLDQVKVTERHAYKAHLAKIHRLLAAPPVLPPVCGE